MAEQLTEDSARWWDAIYCTSGNDETVATMTGSLAAIKAWSAQVEKKRHIRWSIFKEADTYHTSQALQWGTGYWWLMLTTHEFAPGEKQPIEAFSSTTGRTYPTWDDLVAAESNGYTVVVIITGTRKDPTKSWPWVLGQFATKREADNAKSRLRRKLKREAESYPHQTYTVHTSILWKDEHER